jgi:hypothetical protein
MSDPTRTDRAHAPLGKRGASEGVARRHGRRRNPARTTPRSSLRTPTNRLRHHAQRWLRKVGRSDANSETLHGQLTYALADLATIPRAAVVVEDRYSSLFKLQHTKPGFVTEMLAALTVRYPTVPIHFAETRPLAEEWTYRFLGAALAYAQPDKASTPSA